MQPPRYDLTLVILAVALLASRIPRYILLALFGLPIGLLHVAEDWYFLIAIPILAMLVNAIISSRDPVASKVASEPETLPASA